MFRSKNPSSTGHLCDGLPTPLDHRPRARHDMHFAAPLRIQNDISFSRETSDSFQECNALPPSLLVVTRLADRLLSSPSALAKLEGTLGG